jgi:UDP-glucose 4-epimerase
MTASEIKNKKILITGAAGFIGSHLSNRLARDNHVTGVDNLRSGTWDRVNPIIERVEADLSTISDSGWKDLLKDTDVVFHLAAEKHNSSLTSPDKLINTNIAGTDRLFRNAGQVGVRDVVFSSSLYVYPKTTSIGFSESDHLSPHTLYGITKLFGELNLKHHADEFNFNWHCPRFFFIYGPGQFSEGGYKSVIVKNFENSKLGLAMEIYGSGQQSLDYFYIDDLIDLLETIPTFGFSTKIFNVSSGKGISIQNLIGVMQDLTENRKVSYAPSDNTEGTHRFGKNLVLSDLFEHIGQTSINEGLKKTWEYYR